MPRAGALFAEESDSESEIKTENEYAKNYDNWRKKEELNKLKTKYGDTVLDSNESSSSSDDDEDAAELTEEVEKEFFKTLSYLKKKDPKIYDNNVSFFKDTTENIKKEKKVKEQPMYLKDYERKLLLETGGVLSEDEDGDKPKPKTYVKEQEELKKELIQLGSRIDDEEEDETGGLLQLRKKTKEEENKDESEYLKWLSGQKDEIADNEIQSELKPLKEFWTDPKLDNGEKFLRDYILSKRYLDKDDENYVPTYDEIIHDSDNSLSGDEAEIEKQEEFEHKYNFRFEEPDQEFIKRYPRTVEHSLRKTDDKRKIKRAETKERKKKEKEEKMTEIKHMQELKRKEIEEKIEKLKEVTGATDVAFAEDDIDGDFDPEAHDKRMQALFNDDFYEGPETDQKPEFPDIDEELEIENWDHWDGNENFDDASGPHCEDENFNMDADYDPSTSLKQELIENSKGKKKRRRKSKVAEALSKPKPKIDPNDKNYEKYFDEYYKLDCEDIIGDIPCRFKYREVVPNDFGLSVEEILLAKDKELNRWCSLKKTVQRRPENIERYDQIAYSKKANNIALKKKLLPSLFSEEPDQEQNVETPSKHGETFVKSETSSGSKSDNVEMKKEEIKSSETLVESDGQPQKVEEKSAVAKEEKKKRKKKKKKTKKKVGENEVVNNESTVEVKTAPTENIDNKATSQQNNKNKKRKRANSEGTKQDKNKKIKKKVDIGLSDARLSAFGLNPKKFKNKLKYGNKDKKQKS
ncbi:protein KRI1 homolog [Anthonomus grandis grandis]|uniref:protein KRI1 homolog n=1 Tax=Anthonomus grandis grandis TaxID=2921223 RepID=UPI0021650F63|nr:protein KRI1 homolog [Anthonomus grandis grandis]